MIAAGRPMCDREEIMRTWDAFVPPGGVIELRAIKARTVDDRYSGTVSGYFDNGPALADAVARITEASGVYITANPVNPALLARSVNKARRVQSDPTTSDHDIPQRRFLLVDCDAVRPAGISASDEEHEASLERAQQIKAQLSLWQWPDPIEGDSGNGAHLCYRIDLPADDGGLVNKALLALSGLFSDERVKVDTSVHNPARIWKLYGTVACKGDHDAEHGRPHRMARLLAVPEELQVVPQALLEELADDVLDDSATSKSKAGNGSAGDFDLEAWMQQHGLAIKATRDRQNGSRFHVLEECPWNSEHRDSSAFVGRRASGAIIAGCRHNSCQGLGWHDLRAKLDPAWAERRAKWEQGNGTSKQGCSESALAVDLAAITDDDCDSQGDLLAVDPGPLPDDLLMSVPGFIGRTMELILTSAEYPNVNCAFAAATALQAGLAGRKVRCGKAYPNLYLLVLGESGVGKEWPRQVCSRLAMQGGHEDLILGTAGSGAGLEDALAAHPSRVLLWDEFSAFLATLRAGEHEKMRELLLTLYSSAGGFHRTRVLADRDKQHTKPKTIWHPHLTLLATATPDRTFAAIDDGSLIDGLLARVLIVEASPRAVLDSDVGSPDPNQALAAELTAVVRWWKDFSPDGGLVDICPDIRNVPMDQSGKAVNAELEKIAAAARTTCEAAQDSVGKALWARTREHACKLALLYAVSRNHLAPVVDAEAMQWASTLARHVTRRTLYLAGTRVAKNAAHGELQKLLRVVADHPGRRIGHSTLLRRMHMKAKPLQELVETARQAGQLDIDRGPQGGVIYTLKRI